MGEGDAGREWAVRGELVVMEFINLLVRQVGEWRKGVGSFGGLTLMVAGNPFS